MNRTFTLLICSALLMGLTSSPSPAQPGKDRFELDAGLVLRAYRATVDEHLKGVLNGLKALAATQEAMSGDWNRLKGPLASFAKGLNTSAAVWFARPDGGYFTVKEGRTRQNLKDRPYFAELVNGKDVEGSLIVSRSTGARAVIVAAPIFQGGQVTGALGVSLSVARLAKMINEQVEFPDDVVFYALDPKGRTALHKDTSLIFQFPSDIGDESLKSAVHTMLAEPSGIVRYTFRGTRRTVIFDKSALTGWIFALGVSHSD